jgi:hypothetical protein
VLRCPSMPGHRCPPVPGTRAIPAPVLLAVSSTLAHGSTRPTILPFVSVPFPQKLVVYCDLWVLHARFYSLRAIFLGENNG